MTDQTKARQRAPGYPSENCNYAAFLNWHLFINGTRPYVKFNPWGKDEFLKAVFYGFWNERSSRRALNRWLGKETQKNGPPEIRRKLGLDDHKRQVEEVLFENDPELRDLKADLNRAHERSRGEGKNTWEPQKASTALTVSPGPGGEVVVSVTQAAVSQQAADELGLRRDLLENLALRFEHDNPEATDPELREFLREKASEYKKQKALIAELTAAESKISEKLALSYEALGRSFQWTHFEWSPEVDKLYHEAELLQKKQTLKHIWKQANIRINRGSIAFEYGDVKGAYEHFIAALALFVSFDDHEQVRLRLSIAKKLESSSNPDTLRENARAMCIHFLNDNLRDGSPHSEEWGLSHLLLGEVLARITINFQGGHTDSDELKRSVASIEMAIGILGQRCGPDALADMHLSLAKALSKYGGYLAKANHVAEGRRCFVRSIASRELVASMWESAEEWTDWFKEQRALVVECWTRIYNYALADEKEELSLKMESICRLAISHRVACYYVSWGFERYLGYALEVLADFKTGSERRGLLREALDISTSEFRGTAERNGLQDLRAMLSQDMARITAKIEAL